MCGGEFRRISGGGSVVGKEVSEGKPHGAQRVWVTESRVMGVMGGWGRDVKVRGWGWGARVMVVTTNRAIVGETSIPWL